MSVKVVVIKEFEGIPVGSVLQNCESVLQYFHYGLYYGDWKNCWHGVWSSREGSYYETIPKEFCEIWDEEKHDPVMSFIKKDLAEKKAIRIEAEERATLARLKFKYEGVQ